MKDIQLYSIILKKTEQFVEESAHPFNLKLTNYKKFSLVEIILYHWRTFANLSVISKWKCYRYVSWIKVVPSENLDEHLKIFCIILSGNYQKTMPEDFCLMYELNQQK